MRHVGPVAEGGLAPANCARPRVFRCPQKHPLMPVVTAMCLINQLAASPGRSAILCQGVGHSRKAFVDLSRRQVNVAEEYAALKTR